MLDGPLPYLHPEQLAEIEVALFAGAQAHDEQTHRTELSETQVSAAIDGLELMYTSGTADAVPLTSGADASRMESGPEQYAHSLSTMRLLGRLILQGELAPPQELERTEAAQWSDHLTRVAEMLKTDHEFREALDIDYRYSLPVIDGTARNPLNEAETMADMLLRSRDAAIDVAVSESQMWTQVVRDTHDARFMQAGDSMPVGYSRAGVSMFPRQAVERDGATYWKQKGYREGLVFMSFQSKTTEGEREAGVVSVDVYDEAAFREVLRENGVEIPEYASTDEWLSFAVEQNMTADETYDFLRNIRRQYYDRIGTSQKRIEVMDYMRQNHEVVLALFDSFSKKTSVSVASRKLHPDLAPLIESVATIPNLTQDMKERLWNAYRSGIVTDAVGRDLDDLICYATVEQLRCGLPEVLGRINTPESTAQMPSLQVAAIAVPIDLMAAARMAGGNIARGTAAGRNYGSCSGEMKLAQDTADSTVADNDAAPSEAEGDTNPNALVRCPKCNIKSTISQVAKPDRWECPACKYCVDICTGAVKSEGGKMAKKHERTLLAEFFGRMTPGQLNAERTQAKKQKSAQSQANKGRQSVGRDVGIG